VQVTVPAAPARTVVADSDTKATSRSTSHERAGFTAATSAKPVQQPIAEQSPTTPVFATAKTATALPTSPKENPIAKATPPAETNPRTAVAGRRPVRIRPEPIDLGRGSHTAQTPSSPSSAKKSPAPTVAAAEPPTMHGPARVLEHALPTGAGQEQTVPVAPAPAIDASAQPRPVRKGEKLAPPEQAEVKVKPSPSVTVKGAEAESKPAKAPPAITTHAALESSPGPTLPVVAARPTVEPMPSTPAGKADGKPAHHAAEKDRAKPTAESARESVASPSDLKAETSPQPRTPSAPPTAAAAPEPPQSKPDPLPPVSPDRPVHAAADTMFSATTNPAARPEPASVLASTGAAPAMAAFGLTLPVDGYAPELAAPVQARPVEHTSIVDHAVEDPGLSVAVLPHAAHMSIVSSAGDLALHVRVRDGSADINVSGSMAPLVDAKAPEVRTVLATEGLQLGSFATSQHGGQQGQSHGQAEPAAAPVPGHSARPASASHSPAPTPEVHSPSEHGIHVTA
jgi:hypothetical protein